MTLCFALTANSSVFIKTEFFQVVLIINYVLRIAPCLELIFHVLNLDIVSLGKIDNEKFHKLLNCGSNYCEFRYCDFGERNW